MTFVIDTSARLRLFIPDGPLPDGLNAAVSGAERGEFVLLAPELVLTEAGRIAYGYAEDIFALGRELVSALKQRPTAKALRNTNCCSTKAEEAPGDFWRNRYRKSQFWRSSLPQQFCITTPRCRAKIAFCAWRWGYS